MNWGLAFVILIGGMVVFSLVRLAKHRRADDLFGLIFWLVLLLYHYSRYGLLLGLCAFALLGRVLFRNQVLSRAPAAEPGEDALGPTSSVGPPAAQDREEDRLRPLDENGRRDRSS